MAVIWIADYGILRFVVAALRICDSVVNLIFRPSAHLIRLNIKIWIRIHTIHTTIEKWIRISGRPVEPANQLTQLPCASAWISSILQWNSLNFPCDIIGRIDHKRISRISNDFLRKCVHNILLRYFNDHHRHRHSIIVVNTHTGLSLQLQSPRRRRRRRWKERKASPIEQLNFCTRFNGEMLRCNFGFFFAARNHQNCTKNYGSVNWRKHKTVQTHNCHIVSLCVCVGVCSVWLRLRAVA